MLASPLPSLLSSTALPTPIAPGGVAAEGQRVPDFAALLTTVPRPAGAALDPETTQSAPTAEVAVAGRFAAGETFAAIEFDEALPAMPAEAATNAGNILPVALPEAALVPREPGTTPEEGHRDSDSGISFDEEEPAPSALPVALSVALPELSAGTASTASALPAGTAGTAAALPAGTASTAATESARPATTTRPSALPPLAVPTAEPKPLREQLAAGDRNPAAVSIAVAVHAETAAAESRDLAESGAEPAVLPKPARIDALSSPSQPAAPAAAVASTDQAGRVSIPPAAPAPLPMVSPSDIGAALDRLVAAREALMPATAALAIDHVDFGQVSIRFEQASDGRLSAELSSADPVLREAVTAAIAAERGSTVSDGDSGRSTTLANHRGQAAGGDAAPGERGQSGDDRSPHQRRLQGREQTRPAPSNPHPGVFA